MKPFIPWVLVLVTALAYGRVCANGFVNFDDPCYVTENRGVRAGLSLASISWSLRATDCTNWHPLTWLSLQLDYELYGPEPWGYHLTNLLFHLANVVGLYWLLRNLTGAVWRSAAVAAFFAVHPLHVESVAWVAERKDVLSTLFWLLTLGAYLHYVKQPGLLRYLVVLLAFAVGLTAKPMLVTLPFVLLLLDYWPLGRAKLSPFSRHLAIVVLEKVPLFVLSLVSCAITLIVQHNVIRISSGNLGDLPLSLRVMNALLAYVRYIGFLFWPNDLAVFYPHPGAALSPLYAAGAGLALALVTAFVLWYGRRWPYLPVGWFWYLGTLVPVIGLVQVGYQALADRYMYVPSIGLLIMLCWGLSDFVQSWSWGKIILAPTTAVLLIACAFATWRQVGYWHDSLTLWQHALEATNRNWMAHYYVGFAYAQADPEEAQQHFAAALEDNPRLAEAHEMLGALFVQQGKTEDGRRHLAAALSIKPDYALARQNLARVDNRLARTELGLHQGARAVAFAEEACQVSQYQHAEYLETLAAAYAEVERFADAIATTRKALATASEDPKQADLVPRLQTSLRAYEKLGARRRSPDPLSSQ
jgi:Flp pilus assembly protein TadD